MEITLLQAQQNEAPALARMLQDANSLKHERNDHIWGPYDFEPNDFREDISAGNMFIARTGSVAVGCVKVLDSDQRIWGDEGRDGSSIYIHRLAVTKEYRGNNVGSLMLKGVEEMASTRDKESLRLDCETSNKGLCSYYKSLSFVVVRSIELPDAVGIEAYSTTLFQREVPAHRINR